MAAPSRTPFPAQVCPETNPIERVWWHFHETITRNHRCRNLNELLAQAYDWFANGAGKFYFEMRKIFAAA